MTSLTYLGGIIFIIFILNGLMSRESDQEHIICGLRKLGVLRILWVLVLVLRSSDQLRIGGVCLLRIADGFLTHTIYYFHTSKTNIYMCEPIDLCTKRG